MLRRTCCLLSPLLLFLGACDPMPSSEMAALDSAIVRGFMGGTAGAPGAIGVASYNLYVGADLDRVIGALASPDPADDFPELLAGIATLQATGLEERLSAITDRIASDRPAVIGLQEVWTIAIDLTPYGVPATVSQDFLAQLAVELEHRGLDYLVAGTVTNTDAAPIPGIQVVDRDVVLVDPSRVSVRSVVARNFQANIGPVAPGVVLLRGYVMLDAVIDGREVRVVNAHLESGSGAQLAGLRALQAQELAAVTAGAAPVILVGDLNDTPGSPMHGVLTGAGFVDGWATLRPGVEGNTCCHLPDLSNRHPVLTQRIDYIFTRGFDGPGRQLHGTIALSGERTSDRLDGPLHPIWPSDHAGLNATLRLP